MSDAALALCGVLGGCQANVFLLELIISANPNTLYAMTFAQYVVVTLLSLPFVTTFADSSSRGRDVLHSLRFRPMRIQMLHKLILTVFSWLMSLGSNLVFGLYISVPLHATLRSSSLLLNMLAGYYWLGKRYTVPQVLCATAICGGLIVLTIEKSRKIQRSSDDGKEGVTGGSDEDFWRFVGLIILVFTTALSTGLGIFQEYMYGVARCREWDEGKKKKDAVSPPSMWAEAIFFSHAMSIPLFLLQFPRLHREFASISPDNYIYFVFNALTQFLCISGVYVLNDKTSAFTLVLTITLRKLGTFVLSVVYFGHYRYFTTVEWVAMVAALASGTLYPLLPRAHSTPPARLSGVVNRSEGL